MSLVCMKMNTYYAENISLWLYEWFRTKFRFATEAKLGSISAAISCLVYPPREEERWQLLVNGTRQILNGNFYGDALVPFPRHFLERQDKRQSNPKGLELVKLANGTHIFHSEILFGNFCPPFKKSRFPEKLFVRGDKINPSIYIISEISGFFG